jgi:uncharacterized protein YceK
MCANSEQPCVILLGRKNMHKHAVILIVFLALVVVLSGCVTHRATIGSGPHSGQKEVYYQWYALWGLIYLDDEKDAGKLAATSKCQITTVYSPIDCLINFFTMAVTIQRRTIIIEK